MKKTISNVTFVILSFAIWNGILNCEYKKKEFKCDTCKKVLAKQIICKLFANTNFMCSLPKNTNHLK